MYARDNNLLHLEGFKRFRQLYIIAGNKFGQCEGHTLVIHRALYGLCSSGAQWWERLSDVLLEMQFFPSKAENDIWMQVCDHYKYIA